MTHSTIAAAATALAKTDTGNTVMMWIGAVVLLGLGGFVTIFTIYKMASGDNVDISAGGSQIGRQGLIVFLILGILVLVAGIACLVGAIKAVS